MYALHPGGGAREQPPPPQVGTLLGELRGGDETSTRAARFRTVERGAARRAAAVVGQPVALLRGGAATVGQRPRG